MLELIDHNLVPMAVSLALGLATGWWMYRGTRGERDDRR